MLSILTKIHKWWKGREASEVLAIVANSRHYEEFPLYIANSSNYMCISLVKARRCGLITKKELKRALIAISNYLHSESIAMHIILHLNGLPSEFEDTKNIFSNWGNRPKLTNY